MIEAINELPDSFNAPEAISEFANHFGVNPNYLVGSWKTHTYNGITSRRELSVLITTANLP